MGEELDKQISGEGVSRDSLDRETLINQLESAVDDTKRRLFFLSQCCTNASLPDADLGDEDLVDMGLLLYEMGNELVEAHEMVNSLRSKTEKAPETDLQAASS